MLHYLAQCSGHKGEVDRVKDRLLQSNPVLEVTRSLLHLCIFPVYFQLVTVIMSLVIFLLRLSARCIKTTACLLHCEWRQEFLLPSLNESMSESWLQLVAGTLSELCRDNIPSLYKLYIAPHAYSHIHINMNTDINIWSIHALKTHTVTVERVATDVRPAVVSWANPCPDSSKLTLPRWSIAPTIDHRLYKPQEGSITHSSHHMFLLTLTSALLNPNTSRALLTVRKSFLSLMPDTITVSAYRQNTTVK